MPNVSNVPKIFIFKRFFDHSITNGILASHSYEEVILKYEQFLITHLSITQRGPQFIPVQLPVSLLSQLNRNSYQYSICNQTDRRCLLHRVIRSFHGYLEATGRPRACTCARVPWQKSRVMLGQDAWPSVTFTDFLLACSSFRPELSRFDPN